MPGKNSGLQNAQHSQQIALIQAHLKEEAEKFGQGDFADPATIHGEDMPGLAALQAGSRQIAVTCAGRPWKRSAWTVPLWWMVGLLLIGLLSRALAEDTPAGSEQMEAEDARMAYDWAIVKFNTNIKDFPSWEAFATTALAQVVPGTLGTCYAYSGGTVQVTMEPLPREDKETGWQKTPGKGWRQLTKGRRFIEYRVNEKAQALLWIEGVNPQFFFAHTRKMCAVPLGAIRKERLGS